MVRMTRLKPPRATTRWYDHRIEQRGSAVVSSMAVSSPDVDASWRIELRVHDAQFNDVDTSVAPFMGIAGFHAAAVGSDLIVDAPVPRTALKGARDAAVILADYFEFDSIRLEAPPLRARTSGKRPSGLYFSRGVDSFSTLIRYRNQIGVLLGLDWTDPPYATPAQDEIWLATKAAAAEIGLPLLRVTTNARQLLDPVETWDKTNSVVLAGLAALLGGSISEGWISTTHSDSLLPADSPMRPDLLTAWSTDLVTIVGASAAPSRNAKARLVARDELATRWLKVCWQAPGEGNCGTCFKCLQTMSNFAVSGNLDTVAARFRAPLSAAAVASLDVGAVYPHSVINIAELVADLPPSALREAWAELLALATTRPQQISRTEP
jgi:hypothetical protein